MMHRFFSSQYTESCTLVKCGQLARVLPVNEKQNVYACSALAACFLKMLLLCLINKREKAIQVCSKFRSCF